MPVARKVWQLAATPPFGSSAWRTRRLTIRKTSTRFMRFGVMVPPLVMERHSGVPFSPAIPAALTPPHQLFTGKAGVGPQQDRDTWAEASGRGVDCSALW